jgi:hypothetical protein
MVLDLADVVPFLQWLPLALLTWLLVVACLAGGATVIGWLVAAVRHGPFRATQQIGRVLRDAAADLLGMSPRRVWALARLAVQESIRRRIVVVFAVFLVILLFAGWFLDRETVEPARLYLDFVLTATSYLVLLLGLFLSALSLPADLKNRTLHTVVTKPVRASEVVLGRIVGFMVVMSLLLVVMGTISYVFVQRGLAHTHELKAEDLRPITKTATGEPTELERLTSRVHWHRHKVVVVPSSKDPSAWARRVEPEQRHQHALTIRGTGDKMSYQLGPADGMLQARVPIYGKLTFLDPSGQPAEKGVNVGDEWMYRSYIKGGSEATAIWTFQGITEKDFPKRLPLEISIEVFRTVKGDIERGVPGTLKVRNPDTGLESEAQTFESKEYVVFSQHIPHTLHTPKGDQLDLFKDLVSNGRVEIRMQCAAPMQYFGMAQADMYLRARDASFTWNFVKGYVGIWLQLWLVVAIGVMFSTFLSGPVALIATLGAMVGGFFHDFMFRLATGKTYGGGPFESVVRLLNQDNVVSEMQPGLQTTVVKVLDRPAEFGLWLLSAVLPDFGRFSFSEFVASGFNIPGDTLLSYTCRAFGFVLPVFVAGYLCLKNREVAK